MIKFAVVGLGHIGKRHVEMINRNEDCELVATCDINGTAEYESLQDMLKLDFDVLSICTPNGLHYEHSKLGLQHNKHVIVEKPFSLKSTHCRELIDLSFKLDRRIFCVMQNRYSPVSVWLKEVLKSKILGKIYQVHVNCFWNRDERYYTPGSWRGTCDMDGGVLFTQFSHFIDMLIYQFGSITIQHKNIQFGKGSRDIDNTGQIGFATRELGIDSIIGTLNYTILCYDENLESSMTIIAENGSIKIGGQYMNQIDYCHIKDYEMPELEKSAPANDYGTYKGSANNHHKVYENVVNVLKHQAQMTTTALEELEVIKTIENIYA